MEINGNMCVHLDTLCIKFKSMLGVLKMCSENIADQLDACTETNNNLSWKEQTLCSKQLEAKEMLTMCLRLLVKKYVIC